MTRFFLSLVCVFSLLVPASPGHAHKPQTTNARPFNVDIDPRLEDRLADTLTTDERLQALFVFHGLWDELTDPSLLSHDQQAMLALNQYRLDDPLLRDPQTDATLRARAALLRGEAQAALLALGERDDIRAVALRAEAQLLLGRFDQATATLADLPAVSTIPVYDLEGRTALAQARLMRADLTGAPAATYQAALDLLGSVREEDALYWPAWLAEAELLFDKSNREAARESALRVLSLNPMCAEAWALLGRIHAEAYDYDTAMRTVVSLQAVHAKHPLAAVVEARASLRQRDAAHAAAVLDEALSLHATHPELLALRAAAAAGEYDTDATREALARFDRLLPNQPMALIEAGKTLSSLRQYEWSRTLLDQAVLRQPNAAEPRVALALLLMQYGDDQAALRELQHAHRLDPFHLAAKNQLTLAQALVDYERIETEHFVIKHAPGQDAVLARDFARHAEQTYERLTERYGHEPQRLTHVELMPDQGWFAVRITGMPDIWTIAAATGDVLAFSPPRFGSGAQGPYDWLNVFTHEYVHTVTLGATENRIPHWFTEACAVSEELEPRTYATCQQLAEALERDRLFTLDTIDLGFIRPENPDDRSLAYAQSSWMLQYLRQTYSNDSVLDLLARFREGDSTDEAFERVIGIPGQMFHAHFLRWAEQRVDAWGLGHESLDLNFAEPLTSGMIETLVLEHPDHPDVLEAIARWAVLHDEPAQALEALEAYAAARPVDPWPHEARFELAEASGDLDAAIRALRHLAQHDNTHGQLAANLSERLRAQGDAREALEYAELAVRRRPYHAPYRELAATLALQVGDTDAALHHLLANPDLEPLVAVHPTRLAALYQRLARFDESDRWALRAIELDPGAPVNAFLMETP